jgi:NADH-quinone oxidoreductase subunit G
MVRIEARFSEAVNGYFICDRGRYGFGYANLPERPRRARMEREEVPAELAVREAGDRLGRIRGKGGGQSVAAVGSDRSSLETQAMLQRLARACGWQGPWFLPGPAAAAVQAAVSSLDAEIAVTMGEIEGADLIVVVGADPLNEAPMLAMALRQAARKGAGVVVMDPRPVSLPLPFDHLPAAPEDLDLCLSGLEREAVEKSGSDRSGLEAGESPDGVSPDPGRLRPFEAALHDLAGRMRASQRPVIICGTDIVGENTVRLAADLVRRLRATKWGEAGLFFVLPGANAFGAGMLSPARTSPELLEAIEGGAVTALVVVESDPLGRLPDQERVRKSLKGLDFMLVMDCLDSPSVRRADAFLPTQTLFECGGTFVNQEGRAHAVSPVHRGGTPVVQVSGGGHPPRVYGVEIPGEGPLPAHELLARLGEILAPEQGWSLDDLRMELARENPLFARLESGGVREGVRLLRQSVAPETSETVRAGAAKGAERAGSDLELLLVDWTFGTEELSGYSEPIHRVEPSPAIWMHEDDAAGCGLAEVDRVAIRTEDVELEVNLRVTRAMARNVLILPRHRELPWQRFKESRVRVPLSCLSKA